MAEVLVGVDPGRDKCGVAVVSADGRILSRAVVAADRVMESLAEVFAAHAVRALVLGDRTGARDFLRRLEEAGLAEACRVVTVDEHLTSVEARRRYLADHPARGWRRLLPASLRTPDAPYDDYVAVILVERYLDAEGRVSSLP